MPDVPDYSKYGLGSVKFSVQDLGELAVRMGSGNIVDKRGEVVAWDDFRHGLSHWTTAVFGAGSSVTLTNDGRMQSPYRVKLHTGTIASSYALIQRNLPFIHGKRYGIEVILSAMTEFLDILVENTFSDGTYIYRCGWKHTYATNTLAAKTGLSSYEDVDTSIQINSVDDLPIIAKQIIDTENILYSYFRFGGNEYDVTGVPIGTQTFSTLDYSFFRIWLHGKATAEATIYVDSVGLTSNE